MERFEIRKARREDLPAILAIYEKARRFMRAHGNPRQWGDVWPPEALVREDVKEQRSYVVMAHTEEGSPVPAGVFLYLQGDDIEPTYRVIEDGSWLDGSAYGVIHRVASSGEFRGVLKAVLDWAAAQCPHVRIDTHPDNAVMQKALEKNGFTRTGIIHVEEDDDPRYSYERTGRA